MRGGLPSVARAKARAKRSAFAASPLRWTPSMLVSVCSLPDGTPPVNQEGGLASTARAKARAKDGGPDFQQLRPTDGLDAASREVRVCRLVGFARRKTNSGHHLWFGAR